VLATHPLDCKQQATVAVKCLASDNWPRERGKEQTAGWQGTPCCEI